MTTKHPVDVDGNLLALNTTVAALGREATMARLGSLKFKLLKQNGPLIQILGLLNGILGSGSNNNQGAGTGTEYIELTNAETYDEDNNEYVENEPAETIATVEPTATINTVEPTDTVNTVEPVLCHFNTIF